MNSESSSTHLPALLCCLALAVLANLSALGQDSVYAARIASVNSTSWDAPFYWIDSGAYSPYGTSTSKSAAPGTPAGRAGSYYHTARLLSVGEGFGLVHVNGTQAGAVYEVQVTQPNMTLPTDIIMNVGSSNANIGGVFGSTAAGGWTNTTAFQGAYSRDQWALACYLTNRPGVTQPHVDFKYVSGGIGSENTYADCVRFHLIVPGSNAPAPVRVSRIAGTSVAYTGGYGSQFVLLKSASLQPPPTGWARIATNIVTPGSFTIPATGTDKSAFYLIISE